MRSDGEEELTTYNFHVSYELQNNVTTYGDVSIKLDPTASFQETKKNIINEIKKRFSQYSDRDIDVVFGKDKESASPDAPFNRLFPSAQVEIGIKIVLSQPKKIKINYNQTSMEFLFGDNDTFRDIQRMCKIHFNIRDEDIFSIASFEEKNYIDIDQGTNVGNYLANNPESQFTIVLSNSDQGIEFNFYFQNDINHQYQNFREKIDCRLKIGDLYPFIEQRLQLNEKDFFLNLNIDNQWLPIKRSYQFECKHCSPNILIVLTIPIELTIIVSFGVESHEYKKSFRLNQFISDIQKSIVNELKLRLEYNQIKLVQPCFNNKTPVSELINNRVLHFSVENYCINFKRYRPKVFKNKWHQIGLFEYRTIGDLKNYIVKYYNQKGYKICQEFIKIDSTSRFDIGNDKELSAGNYYTAYVPHDILFFDNNYESKSLIKENPGAYRHFPLDNGGDYMASYLAKILKPGKFHVFYEGREMEENDIIPIGRHVFTIQEGTPLKFVVSYKGASQEILMKQDSLITDINMKMNLDIDNPKYHVELKDGTKLMLTNERALDVFITYGNIIIIIETINSLHFITKSDGKSYYFIFRSMSTVQFVKKMLSKRFSFGNDPNLNQISLVQSGKELDDKVSVLDIVQSSNKDPIIIQSQDLSKESEFRVTYQCSYKNSDGKEAIYPLRFKSEPKIGEVVKFMASKLGFSTLKLMWKDEPLDEQPDKCFSDFQIQPEDSLIMLPPQKQATLPYTFSIITLKGNSQKTEHFKNENTFNDARAKLGTELNNIEFKLMLDGEIINEDAKIGEYQKSKFDVVELHKYVIHIYPISYEATTDLLPITTTVKELKTHSEYFNNVNADIYTDIHYKNKPVADDEQLMGMDSLSAKPRPLTVQFVIKGSADPIMKQTLLFYNTLEKSLNIIINKYFINPDQVHLLNASKETLDPKSEIQQSKIVNEDTITIKFDEVDYKFSINGKEVNHMFLPNQPKTEVLEVFLNENVLQKNEENKGIYLIPNSNDSDIICDLAKKYSPKPIEVLWRDPNSKKKYKFVYNEEIKNDQKHDDNNETKKVNEPRIHDFNEDTTIQEVRKEIVKVFFDDGIMEDNVTLMFAGKLLNDFQTLKSINIPKDGIIFINVLNEEELYITTVFKSMIPLFTNTSMIGTTIQNPNDSIVVDPNLVEGVDN